ncbi:ATP-binding protein [Streptomyces sp. NPDC087440]|uniref:ATP-binding protein n=1 Tax=Streptomyces sp. NPDC087440 TaxID=3365790 RepID=UPI0037F1DBD1
MPYEPGADWQYDVPTSGSKRLPPDARYVEALTHQGYGFEAAVADLVDNSLDAGAHKVVISFLRDEDRLVSLLIVDDGQGMDESGLDTAMTVGGQQHYSPGALGKFGTGLKAASMSIADALTVISRTKKSPSSGRRWLTARAREDFRCDIVNPAYCQDLVDRYDGVIGWHGTVIRWDGVRDFESIAQDQTDRFLDETIEKLETHLGLYLHRFLARDDFHLDIAVEEVHTREILDQRAVLPIDPFGYRVPGKAGYPRTLTAPVEGVGDVTLTAHIWPPKSPLTGFRLSRLGTLTDHQGFYFYRNNRLVQAGGWHGFRLTEPHLNLARVAVDLPDAPNDVFKLTVKKDGINTTLAFSRGVEKAVDADGRTFIHYLRDAESVYREASSRAEVKRKAVIPPGKGLDPKIKRAISEELPEKTSEDPIALSWVSTLSEDRFFDLDRENRVIQLNKSYRDAFNGDRRGGSNDAPVVKTLLYLLLEELFGFARWEKKRSDQLDYWNTILLAAVRAERARQAAN